MTDDVTWVKSVLEMCNLQHVAAGAKVPYMTVYRIARGETERPSYEAIQSLKTYFEGKLRRQEKLAQE